MARKDDRSRVDQGKRDTEIRRETDVRGSLGSTPSGDRPKVTPESDMFGERDTSSGEEIRGSSSESRRPQRQPGRMPLPD
jgi:hypothetical protein